MKVLISCGEPSGDLYAGALTRELLALDPSSRVLGMGGEHLASAGGEVVEDYRGLAVTGLSEALAVLPRSYATYRRLVALAKRERPDIFVPIDFPELNFRLARALQRLGIPVVYYICPQVWAWRRGRLQTLKQLVDRALVIFPFEKRVYEEMEIPVEFVGHPLVEMTAITRSRERLLSGDGLVSTAPTVALLPGSRPNEVRAILPDLARAAVEIAGAIPGVQFILARAPNLDDALFSPVAEIGVSSTVVVFEGCTDDVLAAADVVVTASGTATVQTAIHGRPMVIVYRLSPMTYRLVKRFAHVDAAGMVNLIAGRRIVPELIQEAFTPAAVADEVVALLGDSDRVSRVVEALGDVRGRLGGAGASRRAAEAVLEVATRRRDCAGS